MGLFIAMAVSSSASAICFAVGAYPPLVRGRRMVYRHQHHRHRHRRQRQLQVPPSVLPTSSSRSVLRSHRHYVPIVTTFPHRHYVPIVTTFPRFCFACVNTAIVNIQPPHFTVMVLIDPSCALSQNEHSLCS